MRCPVLCGFAVQERGLIPSHLACHPALDSGEEEKVLAEIEEMLLELANEQPESAGLLYGRTFARIVH